MGSDDDSAPSAELVGRLDDEVVRRLLAAAAERNDDIARSVRIAAASASERLRVLKEAVDAGLRTRRYLDYRQSSEWAIEAEPVLDVLADAAFEPSQELAVLVERAVGHVVKVILRADDSDGMIGDLARRLLALHEELCDTGVADPIALAKWMLRFSFDDQDFFEADPVRYAAALGESGLSLYRREVIKRTDADPSSFAGKYALERLAVLDGDVDRIVMLLGGDLANAYQFTKVVEALQEIGEVEHALVWARRGIETTTGWQVAKLVDLAADLLTAGGDPDGVLVLRREQHERTPSSATYAAVKSAAERLGRWGDERDTARKVLSDHDRGGFVDALLADGDADGAWQAAIAEPDWDAGSQRWQRLAEAREIDDPTGAFRVYLRLADEALVTAGRGNYLAAARHLKAARKAATAAGLATEFEDHVRALREQHRRRPTLIEILNRARLP